MSKKKISACFLGVVMLGNVLAAQGEETVEMPKPEGEAVWKYISQENPFNEWTIWEDHQGTDGPDSSFSPSHKLYVNKQAVDSKSVPLNNESMAVSYIRSPADEPQAIVVMYKVKGYNPTAGDWFWARYSLTGEVEDSGKIPRCIACHTKKAADNDYIITHKFDK